MSDLQEPAGFSNVPPAGEVIPPGQQSRAVAAPAPAAFGDSLTAFQRAAGGAGQATQVEQARAVAEVVASVKIAMERPRDVPNAIREMREVCGITMLAERAFFRVDRGGSKVNGESIHLARELARCWGNITYGVNELSRDDARGQSEMLAWAWDMQTNARSALTFIIPHERHTRNGPAKIVGTQAIYENNASFAGRRLRECIFSVLPVWFKAEAAEICHHTLAHGGGLPLPQRIANIVTAYEGIGIRRQQLEQKIGRPVDDFLPEDVAQLGVIFNSIRRGETSKDDEFEPIAGAAPLPPGANAFQRAAAGQPAEPAKTAAPAAPQAQVAQQQAPQGQGEAQATQAATTADTGAGGDLPGLEPPTPAASPWRVIQSGKVDTHAANGPGWRTWWHKAIGTYESRKNLPALRALAELNAPAWTETEQLGGEYAAAVQEIRAAVAAALDAKGG